MGETGSGETRREEETREKDGQREAGPGEKEGRGEGDFGPRINDLERFVRLVQRVLKGAGLGGNGEVVPRELWDREGWVLGVEVVRDDIGVLGEEGGGDGVTEGAEVGD